MNEMQHFAIDVDGVMTDGGFYYTTEGKIMKRFGADDHDALHLLRDKINIFFLSGDKRGFEISKKRIAQDMEFDLHLVSNVKRVEWLDDKVNLAETIFMGDGIFDHLVFDRVGYSICPADGFYLCKEKADFVTRSPGGHRAVAEACMHILEKFFQIEGLEGLTGNKKWSGNWQT